MWFILELIESPPSKIFIQINLNFKVTFKSSLTHEIQGNLKRSWW